MFLFHQINELNYFFKLLLLVLERMFCNYLILLIILCFNEAQNCNYTCASNLEQFSKNLPIIINVYQSKRHLVSTKNFRNGKVSIYLPKSVKEQIVSSSGDQKKISITLQRLRKKPKESKL